MEALIVLLIVFAMVFNGSSVPAELFWGGLAAAFLATAWAVSRSR